MEVMRIPGSSLLTKDGIDELLRCFTSASSSDIHLRVADAAVVGIMETLVGFDTIAEDHLGVILLKVSVFGLGVVGGVVVDRHHLIVRLVEVVFVHALQHIVDVLVAVISTEDGGKYGIDGLNRCISILDETVCRRSSPNVSCGRPLTIVGRGS